MITLYMNTYIFILIRLRDNEVCAEMPIDALADEIVNIQDGKGRSVFMMKIQFVLNSMILYISVVENACLCHIYSKLKRVKYLP